ncbi:collagen-like triple helix repeat-containing protein [Aquimarina rubra]|uniref:Collagen-like protein n=1 Tax=Aquimarina rubra TaxID=1920033 RepID=A0ABW5LF66_9FLAO
MKAMTNLVRLITVLVLSVVIFSCEGEDGAIGPQGEQGEQGPQGEQGEPGTANVMYSDWIDSGFENDITDGFDAFNIDAPEITQEILDTGTILVYARSTTNTIYQVPVTFYGFLNESYFFRVINAGTLNIGVEGIGTNNIGEPFLNDVFRYIIIPGGVAINNSRSTEDFASMSYKEITTLFNISE